MTAAAGCCSDADEVRSGWDYTTQSRSRFQVSLSSTRNGVRPSSDAVGWARMVTARTSAVPGTMRVEEWRASRTLHSRFGLTDSHRVSPDTDEIRRATRRSWLWLIGCYSGTAALATLSGRFAASPWLVCAFLFGFLELATLLAAAYADDWENDFRGDSEIFVRGTLCERRGGHGVHSRGDPPERAVSAITGRSALKLQRPAT